MTSGKGMLKPYSMLNDKRAPIGRALQGIRPEHREPWFIFGQLSKSSLTIRQSDQADNPPSLQYRIHDTPCYFVHSWAKVQRGVSRHHIYSVCVEWRHILRRGLWSQVSTHTIPTAIFQPLLSISD